MFKKWFGKKEEVTSAKPSAPEIMGLRIGGAFELDALKLRLIEPELIIEGAATTHLIQAVGEVKLDTTTTVLRYYTDDDAFLQVLLEGGMTENHISDVKLWYFYQTTGVSGQAAWDDLLSQSLTQSQRTFEDHRFEAVWRNTQGDANPVAMTEKTYNQDGSITHTDQFTMLYERQVNDQLFEYLTFSGEEKIIANQADHCLVQATGFDLQPSDVEIIG